MGVVSSTTGSSPSPPSSSSSSPSGSTVPVQVRGGTLQQQQQRRQQQQQLAALPPNPIVREIQVGALGLRVVVKSGDICRENCDAIVNPTSNHCSLQSGLSRVLREAAGPELETNVQQAMLGADMALLLSGQTLVTGAGNLLAKKVIHVRGPDCRGANADMASADAEMRLAIFNVMRVASELGLHSVVLPGISTGAYAYPAENCARVMLQTLAEFYTQAPYSVTNPSSVNDIRIVLFDTRVLDAFVAEVDRRVREMQQQQQQAQQDGGAMSGAQQLAASIPSVPVEPELQPLPLASTPTDAMSSLVQLAHSASQELQPLVRVDVALQRFSITETWLRLATVYQRMTADATSLSAAQSSPRTDAALRQNCETSIRAAFDAARHVRNLVQATDKMNDEICAAVAQRKQAVTVAVQAIADLRADVGNLVHRSARLISEWEQLTSAVAPLSTEEADALQTRAAAIDVVALFSRVLVWAEQYAEAVRQRVHAFRFALQEWTARRVLEIAPDELAVFQQAIDAFPVLPENFCVEHAVALMRLQLRDSLRLAEMARSSLTELDQCERRFRDMQRAYDECAMLDEDLEKAVREQRRLERAVTRLDLDIAERVEEGVSADALAPRYAERQEAAEKMERHRVVVDDLLLRQRSYREMMPELALGSRDTQDGNKWLSRLTQTRLPLPRALQGDPFHRAADKKANYEEITGATHQPNSFRARIVATDEQVCIKEFPVAIDDARRAFLKEVGVLRKISHPNIASMIGFFEAIDGRMWLVSPYYGDTTLNEWLSAAPRSDDDIRSLFQQLVQGLIMLHQNGVIHADLRMENVIVRDDGRPVIVNFEVSVSRDQLTKRTSIHSIAGAQGYLAPELLADMTVVDQFIDNPARDMWALAVLLLKAYSSAAELPVVEPGKKSATLPLVVLQRAATVPYLGELLTSLLTVAPTSRMSAVVASSHPYFTTPRTQLVTGASNDFAVSEQTGHFRRALFACSLVTAAAFHQTAIRVARASLVDDLTDFMLDDFVQRRDEYLCTSRVYFANELGVDLGGPLSDMYTQYFRRVCTETPAFHCASEENGYYMPASTAAMSPEERTRVHRLWKAFGMLLARCIVDDRKIPQPLISPFFWTAFSGGANMVRIADRTTSAAVCASLLRYLELVDATVARSLRLLLQSDEVASLCMYFGDVHPMFMPVGRAPSDLVESSNATSYVCARARTILLGGSVEGIGMIRDSMLNYLRAVSFPQEVFDQMSDSAWKQMLCAEEMIDVERMLSILRVYGDWSPHSMTEWMTRLWRSFTQAELRAFLEYVTGMPSVPADELIVRGVDQPASSLPDSHTCFKMLDVSLHLHSYDDFERQVRLAMTWGVGFGVE